MKYQASKFCFNVTMKEKKMIWTFRIVKTRKKPKEKEANVEYPRVIKEVSENPSQYGY